MPGDKVVSEEEPEVPEGMISTTDFLNAAKERLQKGTAESMFVEQREATVSEKTTMTEKKSISEDELQIFVAESLAKIELARQRMARDQAEIDQLKNETRTMISKLLAA